MYLDGTGWKANYFRPKRPLIDGESEINNLLMKDGLDASAHMPGYNDAGWFDTEVPSDVRDILVKNSVIPDPYLGRNSDATAWVVDYEWWYRKIFKIPGEYKGKRIRAVFKGVDLFADYYFNGDLIGSSNDMFVSNIFEITKRVRFGEDNLMAVRIHPQPKSSANHFWRGEIPQRAYYPKAQVSWGWDWSREMVSMGIWDSVYLESVDTVFIDDLFLEARPTGKDTADLRVELEVNSAAELCGEVAIDIFDNHTGHKVLSQVIESVLKPGNNKVSFVLPLEGVVFWHPNGYGDQRLYKAALAIRKSGRDLALREATFGVREIKMLANTEVPTGSYNLVFNINGINIFAMGANWVPVDLLFARAEAKRYEYLVKMAAELGFNMLRIWGGGTVEKDAFYDCCDKYGILVWQEFPLACANYPKDDTFVSQKEKEADFIIKKLRNHPSIALYCGGNELFYYGESSRSPVLRMFKDKVSDLHPAIDYHYSSPDKEREGERDHGPWTYQEKHHTFWNNHFRNFASELGCNACISYENLSKFLTSDDVRHRTQALKHHFINFEDYKISRSYSGAKLFNCQTDEDVVFASQFVQADTLSYVMGKYRTNVWRSSGVLFWQYNSAWPEGMWSIIDYYGTPKLACYFLREVCARAAVHIEDDDWELHGADSLRFKVHFLGDGFSQDGEKAVKVALLDKEGKEKYRKTFIVKTGSEISIHFEENKLYFKEGFFRLNVSAGLGSSITAAKNQFYALRTWKEVKIEDLQDAVSLVYGAPR